MRPLPWHRRYNWHLIWRQIKPVLFWLSTVILAGILLWLVNTTIDTRDDAVIAKDNAHHEHQARADLLRGLQELSRNGQLTETDIREGTVCMNDLNLRRK